MKNEDKNWAIKKLKLKKWRIEKIENKKKELKKLRINFFFKCKNKQF